MTCSPLHGLDGGDQIVGIHGLEQIAARARMASSMNFFSGKDYIVWDKSASICFLRPGRGTVTAEFHIPQARVDEICAAADAGEKVEPVFKVDVLDEQGEAVARVEKLLYVRKKD